MISAQRERPARAGRPSTLLPAEATPHPDEDPAEVRRAGLFLNGPARCTQGLFTLEGRKVA